MFFRQYYYDYFLELDSIKKLIFAEFLIMIVLKVKLVRQDYFKHIGSC